MKYFLAGFLVALVGVPSLVHAQGNLNSALGNLGNVGARAGTSEAKIENVVGNIINGALSLIGIVFLVLMVYAGYLWMTARGEEDQVGKAKKIISSSIIGIVVVVSAYAITFFVTSRLSSGQVQCCVFRSQGGVDVGTVVSSADQCGTGPQAICAPNSGNTGCSVSQVSSAAQCN